MSIVIRILAFILILLAFISAALLFVYVIEIELNEIFEVDVLFKVKRKLEVICYGQTKALGKLQPRRKRKSSSDRTKVYSIKKRIRDRKYYNKTIQDKKKQIDKKA